MKRPHPGQMVYPDLQKKMTVSGLGEAESPQIDVSNGKVTFSRWSEYFDDRVSFTISEWDFVTFVEAWLDARMEQALTPKTSTKEFKAGDIVKVNQDHAGMKAGEVGMVVAVRTDVGMVHVRMSENLRTYNLLPEYLEHTEIV